MEQPNLADEFSQLIPRLKNVDYNAAKRLQSIADSVNTGDLGRLAYVDLHTLLDPSGIEERAAVCYERRPRWLGLLEWLRNVLVLCPIMLTWLGLAQASAKYAEAVASDGNLVKTPFLYLWETGFPPSGIGRGDAMTFSTLATADFVLLLFVVLLTLVIHLFRDIMAQKAEREASRLRNVVERVLWSLSQLVAESRAEIDPALAPAKITEAVRAFTEQSGRFIDKLADEQNRLAGIGSRWDQQVTALNGATDNLMVSAHSIRQYGTSLHESGQDLHAAVAGFQEELQQTLGGLGGFTAKTGQQQQGLVAQLTEVTKQAAAWTRASETTTDRLGDVLVQVEPLAASYGKSTEALGNAVQSMQGVTAQFSQADGNLRQILNKLAEASNGTTTNAKALADQLTETSRKVEEAVKGLVPVSAVLAALSDEVVDLRQVNQGMIPKFEEGMRRHREGADQMNQQLSIQFQETLRKQSDGTTEALARVVQGINLSTEAVKDIRNQQMASRETDTHQLESIQAATISLTQSINDIKTATTSLADASQGLNSSTQALLEVWQRFSDEMDRPVPEAKQPGFLAGLFAGRGRGTR